MQKPIKSPSKGGAGDTVFLLDDEPAVQAVLTHTLEKLGFRVRASTQWAEIARSVLDQKAGRAFLVADLNMPGIRGEDFCRVVRAYRPTSGIVLFTGADDAVVAAAAQRLGGVPVVGKREGAARVCEVLSRLMAGADVSGDTPEETRL
jgi:FixJ family two-component response regulator